MKKNKGIIITGGKLNAKNIVTGKDAKIEIQNNARKEELLKDSSSQTESSKTSDLDENLRFVREVKQEIANGQLSEAIKISLQYFKNKNDLKILNKLIILSGSLTQLELQEDIGVITREQGKADRVNITSSLLKFLDQKS